VKGKSLFGLDFVSITPQLPASQAMLGESLLVKPAAWVDCLVKH